MFSHIAAFIVGCEIAFWVVLAAGLVFRYLLRLGRTGAVLLALIPLIDVVLLAAVAVDLHNGAEVGWVHRVAGIYLGVSVAFGPSVVRWADRRFAYHFAGGAKPEPAPKKGPEASARNVRTSDDGCSRPGSARPPCSGSGRPSRTRAGLGAVRNLPHPRHDHGDLADHGPVWVLGKQ